jgi:Cof subfamily protein (haloacid dehalogenase superfamily)
MRLPPKTPALFAVDLDGTLVEPRQPVRPGSLAAVKRVMAAGVAVTIVTGRMVVGAKPFADMLGLDGELICYQGAVIADARTGRFEREVALPNALALRAYAVARAHDFHVQFYRDDRFYVEEDNVYAQLYARTSGSQPIVVPSLPEAFEGHDSTKVNIVTDPARTPAALALFADALGNEAYVTRSNPEFVEILNSRVDKGTALRLVAEHLGIAMDDVVAIGDSYNDLPLLRAAGFSIAMGSAPDELKALADAVVGDVEHDGVAEAVERFVLPPHGGSAADIA